MAKVFIEETTLSSIGDAIREKGGTNELINPLDMPDAIYTLPSGGGDIPEEAFTITGDCNYRFSYGGWDWFINLYGRQIKTKNITNCSYMFSEAKTIKKIPFDINLTITSSPVSITNIFKYCYQLEEVPYIIGGEISPPTGNYTRTTSIEYIFMGCYRLREIPYDWFWKYIPNKDYWDSAKNYTSSRGSIFWNCYSLRELPDISMLPTSQTYGNLYNYGFNNCYTLNKIINLPIVQGDQTSNMFSNTFTYCSRLKDLIFETNEDNTPKTANWKSQTLDLTSYVGYPITSNDILNYNSGITADKEVKDDATYQALKDDPDWYCVVSNIQYSRYNHTSAVNTINSLPDTSAYLATAGGTNTIKFRSTLGDKIVGSATDGGAIADLTEEEIAVATAKGWTVSLV